MEETLLLETKKSPMMIVGDLLKVPWIFLVFVLIYFIYLGITTSNFLGLYSVLGIFIVSFPIKYFFIGLKTFTLTNYRTIVRAGSSDNSRSLELIRIVHVGLEYPKFGKSLDYGHVVITYDRDQELVFKNLKKPYDFAKELTEAMRYAKAAALRNNAS